MEMSKKDKLGVMTRFAIDAVKQHCRGIDDSNVSLKTPSSITIIEEIKSLLEKANANGSTISKKIYGIKVVVNPGADLHSLVSKWELDCEQRKK